jgi:hypothetical protein
MIIFREANTVYDDFIKYMVSKNWKLLTKRQDSCEMSKNNIKVYFLKLPSGKIYLDTIHSDSPGGGKSFMADIADYFRITGTKLYLTNVTPAFWNSMRDKYGYGDILSFV